MGTKYSSNSASGYNATPPSDDATVSEANKGKWSTIKDKLADPVKTLADAINTDLVEHFDNGPVAYTTNQTIGAAHYGKVIQVSGAANTQTLSDAATLGAGWNCEFVSTDTTNTVTIARATASDMINETTANISLLPLQSVQAVVNAAANGFLVKSERRTDKMNRISEEINMSGKSLWMAEGANVASASDCNIWTTDGNTVHVTGTTTITDWGTAPQAGAWKRVIFDGALTLTYHATTNDIPGDADKTTAANDSCIVYARSASSYQIFDYTNSRGTDIIATASGTAASYLGVATFSPTVNVNVGDTVTVNYQATGTMNGTNSFAEHIIIGESGAGTCVLEYYPSRNCEVVFASMQAYGSGQAAVNSYSLVFKVTTAGTLVAVGGTAVSEINVAPTGKNSYVYAEVRRGTI